MTCAARAYHSTSDIVTTYNKESESAQVLIKNAKLTTPESEARFFDRVKKFFKSSE